MRLRRLGIEPSQWIAPILVGHLPGKMVHNLRHVALSLLQNVLQFVANVGAKAVFATVFATSMTMPTEDVIDGFHGLRSLLGQKIRKLQSSVHKILMKVTDPLPEK